MFNYLSKLCFELTLVPTTRRHDAKLLAALYWGLMLVMVVVCFSYSSMDYFVSQTTIWESHRHLKFLDAGSGAIPHFSGDVRYPSYARPNESFLVELDLSFNGVTYADGRVLLDDDPAVLAKANSERFPYALHLAGADVIPKKPILISANDTAIWSVKPKSTGVLRGVIAPVKEDIGNTGASIPNSSDLSIEIDVRNFLIDTILQWVLALIAPMLVGPFLYGLIMAYLERRRDLREEKAKETEIAVPSASETAAILDSMRD